MKYIVSVSGGLGSAEALKRTIDTYGKDNTIAVFCDVKGDGSMPWLGMSTITKLLHERFGGENRDTYKFLWQLSHALDIEIERLDGWETIWDVFFKRKALSPMTSVCPASEQLKRERIAQWIEKQGYKPGEWCMVLGMGWDEEHRIKSSSVWWSLRMGYPVPVIAPNAKMGYFAYVPDKKSGAIFTQYPCLYQGSYATNEDTALWAVEAGCEISDSYKNRFEHDNCGNLCILGGLAHFANVYNVKPDFYWYMAWLERMFQRAIGKGYTILRNMRKGCKVALTLYSFASHDVSEAKLLNNPNIISGDYPKLSTGACTCFTDISLLKEYVNKAPKPTIQLKLAM